MCVHVHVCTIYIYIYIYIYIVAVDFNSMSTCQWLFYAKRLGNYIHFLCSNFFYFHSALSNMNNINMITGISTPGQSEPGSNGNEKVCMYMGVCACVCVCTCLCVCACV